MEEFLVIKHRFEAGSRDQRGLPAANEVSELDLVALAGGKGSRSNAAMRRTAPEWEIPNQIGEES